VKKARVKRPRKRAKKLPSASRNFQPLPQYNIPPTINYTMPPQQPENLLNFISSAMSIFDATRLPKRENKIFRNSDQQIPLYFDMATDTNDLPKREQITFRNTANGDALYSDIGTDTNDLLPKSFRDANVGEDVPIQSLVEKVQQEEEISLKKIPDVVRKQMEKDKMKKDQIQRGDIIRDAPIIEEEGEELMTIVPRKRSNTRVKPKENLIRDVESLLPDIETRRKTILSYKRERNIEKGYQNFNIKELEDLLSYLTSKN